MLHQGPVVIDPWTGLAALPVSLKHDVNCPTPAMLDTAEPCGWQ